MVNVDTMITTAGALLAGVAIEAPLAGAFDLSGNPAAIHMSRALATATASSGSFTNACAAEGEACAADQSCLSCNEVYAAQAEACSQSVASDAGGSLDICGLVEDLFCCATDGCWDNAAYADLLECAQTAAAEGNDIVCLAVDIGTCSGGAGGGVVTSDSTVAADDTTLSTDRDLPTTVDSTTTLTADDSSVTLSGETDVTTADSTTLTDPATTTTTSDRGIGPIDSTTTTTTPVTDGTASSTTGETTICQAEQDACTADPECLACGEELGKTSDAAEATCRPAGYDEETATCDEKLEVGCCSVAEGPECVLANAALVAWIDCLAVEGEGCDISISTCADGGDSSTLVGGDDATTSDRGVTPVDSTTTATDGTGATDGEETEESLPFLGGDDEGEEEEADGVEVDVDDEDPADADAADADTDSATPSAVGGGATAVFVAAAVSLAFMAA